MVSLRAAPRSATSGFELGRRAGGLPLVAVLLCLSATVRADEAAQPLPGRTHDYAYDGRDIKHPERAWLGRAYLPRAAAKARRPLPLVVFLHGLNAALIKYRWLGGGKEGDVRRIVGDLVERGVIGPAVVAGPSSVIASQVTRRASWDYFDLDNFLDRTIERLRGIATIDETRIVVAGHSGAGCSTAGGLATAPQSRRQLLAILSIDTCMGGGLAQRLAAAGPHTHVVASYQNVTWRKRPFGLFRRVFERETKKRPAAAGVLREIDVQQPRTAPHDAMVALAFERWLPQILPPSPRRP